MSKEPPTSPKLDGSVHPDHVSRRLHEQRHELLTHVTEMLQRPMLFLSFVWVALLIIQFTEGADRIVIDAGYVIWALFILQFLVEFTIAPVKSRYLEEHWITAVSLLVPALRLGRLVRVIRLLQEAPVARSLTLVTVLGSTNRGMRAARNLMGRRGVGYVVALSALVILIGAAGMLQFESASALRQAGFREAAASGVGLHNYADAIWYTAMVLTTIGSAYWPYTAEGRILTLGLALYGMGTLGYMTAILASYFVGQDTATGQTAAPADEAEKSEIGKLHDEIHSLREQIAGLAAGLKVQAGTPDERLMPE